MSQKRNRLIFAQLAKVDLCEVAVVKLAAAIFKGRHFSFTENGVHLDVKNRIGFTLDNSLKEPCLCLTDEDDSSIQMDEEILYMKPLSGNSSPRWASYETLEKELAKIRHASFVRVMKETYRGTKLCGEPVHFGTFYWSHFTHLSEYQDGDYRDYHFRYTFESKKFDGEWIPIEDPRGFEHTIPTPPTQEEMVKNVIKPKTIDTPGTGTLKTAFQIALKRADRVA